MPRFGTMLTAMVTPLREDGSIDVPGAVELARWLVDEGSEGLVVTGTTGEAPTLTDEEDWDLWRAVAEAVTVPVLAGSGTNDTAHSVYQAGKAEECGVDALLIVCPYYNRPSQAGIEAHMTAVAQATSLPIMMYDIPFRTGRKIANETMLRLAREQSNIVAVKDAAGDIPSSAELIAAAPDGFELYSGEDKLTLPLLSVGAVGVVSVASHWAGPTISAMLRSFASGDTRGAADLNRRLMPSWAFESSDVAPNPVPTKAMLRTLGLPAGECRWPVGPTPAGLEDEAKQVFAELREP